MSPGKVSTLDFETFYNIIDGKQRGSDKIHHGINPATGQELWDVPIASQQDLDDAVAAAKKAFPAWRDTPVKTPMYELHVRHTLTSYINILG
jgi:delta 1-pyrroline-5-carboxylate dehydrogenase